MQEQIGPNGPNQLARSFNTSSNTGAGGAFHAERRNRGYIIDDPGFGGRVARLHPTGHDGRLDGPYWSLRTD